MRWSWIAVGAVVTAPLCLRCKGSDAPQVLSDGKTFTITFPGAYEKKLNELGESYERGGYMQTHYRLQRMQSSPDVPLAQDAARLLLGIRLPEARMRSAVSSCPKVRGAEVREFGYQHPKGPPELGCIALVRTPDRTEVLAAAVYPIESKEVAARQFLESFQLLFDSSEKR